MRELIFMAVAVLAIVVAMTHIYATDMRARGIRPFRRD